MFSFFPMAPMASAKPAEWNTCQLFKRYEVSLRSFKIILINIKNIILRTYSYIYV